MVKKKSIKDTSFKFMNCGCGQRVKVFGDVSEVKCCFCIHKYKSLLNQPLDAVNKKDAFEKEKEMDEKNEVIASIETVAKAAEAVHVAVAKPKMKRGRKSVIGTTIVDFVKSKGGQASFSDILNVYSGERAKLGKKSSDDAESRNLHSMLFMLEKSGQIQTIQKNVTYGIRG